MGFFDDIKGKIFGPDEDERKAQQDPAVARRAAEVIGQAAAAKVAASSAATPSGTSTVGMATPTSNVAPSSSVDVDEVLDAAVAKSGQDLRWKTSIVDLLKALGLDSSITARKPWQMNWATRETSRTRRR